MQNYKNLLNLYGNIIDQDRREILDLYSMAWSDYLMNIHEITLIPFINLVQVVYILFIVHIRWICYGLSLVTVLY